MGEGGCVTDAGVVDGVRRTGIGIAGSGADLIKCGRFWISNTLLLIRCKYLLKLLNNSVAVSNVSSGAFLEEASDLSPSPPD